MRGVPRPAMLAGVSLVLSLLCIEAAAVLCTGQYTGATFVPATISWNPDDAAFDYNRSYQYTLNCSDGDSSGCHLCRKVVLEQATGNPDIPWSYVSGSFWNTNGLDCNSTNNSISVNLTIPNLSRGTVYRITFYYSVGDCNDDDSYNIADTDYQTTPSTPRG